MATWWNEKYLFRRQIKIVPATTEPVLEGHPIHVSINKALFLAMNKIRADLNDIEIVYSPEIATPAHTVVGYRNESESGATVIDLVFNAVDDFIGVNTEYYVYYNNASLASQPLRPSFVNSDYVVSLEPTDYNSNLTFSRPNEDWFLGFSDKINARAALSFYGTQARIRVEKGPDRGILEIKIDEQPPIFIDTYNYSKAIQVGYATSGLAIAQHYIRLRVTGDKHPSSSGYGVELTSLDYSTYVASQLLSEEIKSSSPPVRTIVGP